jgi:YgiT-type zinc finger domain-containing protein
MTCVICKQGQTRPGKATIALERGGMTLVIKAVPAQVCEVCGEAYVDEATTTNLLRQAAEASKAGVEVDVRTYIAA